MGDTLVWITSELVALYGDSLQKVILTGSRARGDNRPDSDWDIVVVLADTPSAPKRTMPIIRERLWPPDGTKVEVIELSEEGLAGDGRFAIDCRRDGRKIWCRGH
jgi:predicted nucleotidyltransferase